MELQEIEIIISPDGQVQVQVRGVNGMQCLEITKEMEEALGGQIITRVMTPEALEGDQRGIDQDQQLRPSR